MSNFTLNMTDLLHSSNVTSGKIPLSRAEYVYTVLTAVTSALSIFGGVCICALYFAFKDMRSSGRKLLLFLGISDAILATGNLLGVIWFLYRDSNIINKNTAYCVIQSAVTVYFSITAFSWTVIMAICLFVSTVLNKRRFTETYMKLFHLITWIPPGIILIVALSMNVFGYDRTLDQATWCWIDPRVDNALVWQFATGKFWEILAYITTVILYTLIKVFLWKQSKKSSQIGRRRTKTAIIQDANRKLTFVPLVFIVLRIWGTVRFLLGYFAQDIIDEPYVTWIIPLQGIGDSGQGFANFVLYCFSTTRIRNRVMALFCPSRARTQTTLSATEPPSKSVRKATVEPSDHNKPDSKETSLAE